MGKRLIAVSATLGLLIGLVAGVLGAGLAGAETPPGSQSDLIFFPWVPNGETLNNSSPWYGAIVVQNLESVPINVELGRSAGGVFPVNVIVQPHAAYTFSSADLATELGWTGDGGGVVAAATWLTSQLPSTICQSETGSLVATRSGDVANLPPGMTKTADQDVLAGLPLGATVSAVKFGGTTYQAGSIFTVGGNEITWTSGTRPADGKTFTVIYTTAACTRGPLIGGVEKQAAPTAAGFDVSTNNSMTSVDGYTAIPDTDVAWGVSSTFCQEANPSGVCNNLGSYDLGWPVGGFDGTSYLPIVQGNYSGWDTYLHATNIDASTVGSSQVTITYYSQGQGVGDQGSFVEQFTLAAGESKTFNLANDAPAGFVGSAWITAQNGIVVSASRVKGTMALTNTSVPSVFATTSQDNGTVNNGGLGVDASCISGFCTMYAPLVYLDYNGWNTGFNIVNTSEFENQVTINVVNRDGTSVGVYTTAIPPKGMQYVYIPAGQDQGLGQSDFTAAILSANAPFNATVDEVKYTTGEAMSYNATATLAVADNGTFKSAFFGNSLSLPLYQAGNVSNGISHGDTSGINLFNPTGNSVSGRVDFYMSTGAAAGSTQIGGGTPFTIGAMGSALVAYAPSQANITPGSQLSAIVTVTSGKGGVVGVSNEVNYDVNGDGGVVFNMLNLDGQYRYACSQTSCGTPLPPVSVFAASLTLKPNQQWHAVNSTATVTATAFGSDGNPLAGVPVTFTVSGPNAGTASPSTQTITTGSNGKAHFSYTNSTDGTDTVSATAPAPNGGTLNSLPPSVKVHWTIPTLAVSVPITVVSTSDASVNPATVPSQTVSLSDNNVGGTTPSPSYTWTWVFTVTGYSDCSDVPTINWQVGSNSPDSPQRFGPTTGYSGLSWTKSGNDTCTASGTYTSPNPDALAGKTKTYKWTLASTPVTTGNNTQITWLSPVTFNALVEITSPSGEVAATSTNPGGFVSTINASDFTGVIEGGLFNEDYQFTYTDPTLADCSTLSGATVNGTATGSDTTGLGNPPAITGLTWTFDSANHTCTAEQDYENISLAGRAGTIRSVAWSITVGTDTVSDGTTTVNYPVLPTFDTSVEIQNPEDTTDNTGYHILITADQVSGVLSDNDFNEVYRFMVRGVTDPSILTNATVYMVTGTGSQLDFGPANYTPGTPSGFGGTLSDWTCDSVTHNCWATVTYSSSLADKDKSGTAKAGLTKINDWSITLSDGIVIDDGTTTITYPTLPEAG